MPLKEPSFPYYAQVIPKNRSRMTKIISRKDAKAQRKMAFDRINRIWAKVLWPDHS